jgi:hypothetical protein
MSSTLDKLVTAIQAERVQRGGEGRRVFLHKKAARDVMSTDLRWQGL